MNIRARQDAIVRSLRRSGTTTVARLSEEVGASQRTVLRDLNALRDEGFVIHSDVGRGGGLQLDPSSIQMRTRLSVPEVFALLISVSAMKAAGNLPFSSLADSGLAKIERALPADKLKDLREILERLYIGRISPSQDISDVGEIDPELLPTFEICFLKKQYMGFEYQDAKGRKTKREVEPQAILILPPLWYIVAWDDLRGDFRHFRMDRMRVPMPLERANRFRLRHVPFEDDVCAYRGLKR